MGGGPTGAFVPGGLLERNPIRFERPLTVIPGPDPLLSGSANPVATAYSIATTDTPWPDLIRSPTSYLAPKVLEPKTWMPGTSPGTGNFEGPEPQKVDK